MSSRAVYVCCALVFLIDFAISARFDNCRVGQAKSPYDLHKFEHNSPRKDEIIRAKVYFKTNAPYLSVTGFHHRIVFGKFFVDSESIV